MNISEVNPPLNLNDVIIQYFKPELITFLSEQIDPEDDETDDDDDLE